LSAISGERKAASRKRKERPTTAAISSGRRARNQVALVDDRGGQSADADVDTAVLDLREEVFAQPVHEVGGCRVLWRARWHDRENRGVPAFVEPRFAHEGDAGVGSQPLGERGKLLVCAGGRQIGGKQERPVRAGAEPGADELVRITRGRSDLIVARIGEAEAQSEGRSSEGDQHDRPEDRGRPGSSLNEVAPAAGQRLAACGRNPPEAGNAQAVDAVAGEGQQRRQQRDRSRHGDEDGETDRDGDAVEEGHAQQEQAEERDDDRRPGDEDAAPGRADGLDDGRAWIAARGEGGAEAGQDQERIVDPDADPDDSGNCGGEAGDVDERGEDADQQNREPEPEERDRDQQPDRHDRSEGDEEDGRGGDQTDDLGTAALLRVPNRRPAELDREAVAARGLGQLDQARTRLRRHVQRRAVELEAGEGDRAVARHARRLGGGDTLEAFRPLEETLDAPEDGLLAGTGFGLPDDLDRVTRGACEALGDEVGRCLRLRAGRRKFGGELPREARGDSDGDGKDGDPRQHHPAAPAVGQVGEAGEASGEGRGNLSCA